VKRPKRLICWECRRKGIATALVNGLPPEFPRPRDPLACQCRLVTAWFFGLLAGMKFEEFS
jgi:hypothetical protein